MTAEQRWAALVETMLAQGAATYGSDGPQRAFGSTSLKTDGKIFAMLVKDRLVVNWTGGGSTSWSRQERASDLTPGTAGSRRNGSMSTPHQTTSGWSSRPRRRRSWRDDRRRPEVSRTGGSARGGTIPSKLASRSRP